MKNNVNWDDILEVIHSKLNPLSYDTWFKETKLIGIKNNTMQIEVPMEFHKKILNQTYYDLIGTDSIEVVARYINGEVTEIICDEEGKLKEHQYISGISNDFRETLVGNLIIKSTDPAIPVLVAHYGTLQYSFRRS